MPALAGEGQKVLMIAVSALNAGKTIVQVAAVQVPVDDLQDIGSEESIGPLKSFFVTLDENEVVCRQTASCFEYRTRGWGTG